ncbi:hypothetical protein XA68_12764 [Ophiocordyceps unilateralis]|uniref:Thioesterase domain-containing protein n=1 Tax=Ophiocordyceps unilateralis TaxID=268505 RepID=A0A2A9PD58_OPHUN|nr:hypothetical protein XA68_12764 [Ophiocordyceps unilateralis]
MATTRLPDSVTAALDLSAVPVPECSLRLSNDMAFGAVSHGGFVASLMTKYAIKYASEHPKLRLQTDVRSSMAQFYRPVLPSKPATLKLRESSLGKAWSTLRVDLFQADKIAASVDVTICSFSLPSISLPTKWELSPPPRRVDLSKLETESDPDWVSYQPAFYPDGFRRGHAYVRTFIPKDHSTDTASVEQWICPGWDCFPLGSCAALTELDQARWTTEMLQYAADLTLPVQENLFPRKPGSPLPMGSVAAVLEFAAEQKRARKDGRSDWRPLANDGSKTIMIQTVHVTLNMTTEIKKKLPPEGVRWLYARTEAKSIVNGRLDAQVLLFDERMELVAISNQVNQIIPATQKSTKAENRETAQL